MGNRGYFEIGVYGSKCPDNVGTLMRSAFQMGAAGIFTIGARYPKSVQDTIKSFRHVPLRHYQDMTDFMSVGLETGDIRSYRTWAAALKDLKELGAPDIDLEFLEARAKLEAEHAIS